MGVFKGDELVLGAKVTDDFGIRVELVDVQENSMISLKSSEIVFEKGIGPLMKSLEKMVNSVVDETPLYDLEVYPGNGNQRYEERTSGNIYEFGVFKNGGLWLGVRIQPFNGNPNLFEVVGVNKEEKGLDGKGGRFRGIQHVCVEQENGMDGRLGKNDHGNVFQKSELPKAFEQAKNDVYYLINGKTLGVNFFDGLDEK